MDQTTAPTPYVSYLRVSTQKQGASGLGLEAQRAAVAGFITSRGGVELAEFVEVETGKGTNALQKRSKLREAVALAKSKRAVLVIAKLDRLARNTLFICELMDSGVEFVACDIQGANRFMLHVMAAMAEEEARAISARTKAALGAAKARGVKLGVMGGANVAAHNAKRADEAVALAEGMRSDIQTMKARGLSLRAMAARLTELGHAPASGGQWHAAQVSRIVSRLGL